MVRRTFRTKAHDILNFEAEVAVIVDEVPMGYLGPKRLLGHVKLVMLANDVRSSRLRPVASIRRGFGFSAGEAIPRSFRLWR